MARIALIVEASGGGTGTHVADLTHHLLKRGHSVHLLYSSARSDSRFRSALDSMQHMEGFHAQPFRIRHNLHPADISTVFSLAAYLTKHKPFDAVHCHSTKAGLVGRLAARLCRTPAFYTAHGIITGDPSISPRIRRMAAVLERTLARISDTVIAVSDVERQHMIDIGLSSECVKLIPNGVDIAGYLPCPALRAEIRSHFRLRPTDPCVGFIGRFVAQKRPDVLLAAFAQVHRALPGAKLMLVGNGPLQEDMIRLATKLDIDGSVFWCGDKNAGDVLPAFDILALSSCWESCPYVVLEAMAAGLPVVATDVGGLRMLVRSGWNGILVPPGDSELLGASLLKLCRDARLRSEMGMHSLQSVQDFSLDLMIERIEELYRRGGYVTTQRPQLLQRRSNYTDAVEQVKHDLRV
jgi:glycosyltransferase involved in cell wall biosynthesis